MLLLSQPHVRLRDFLRPATIPSWKHATLHDAESEISFSTWWCRIIPFLPNSKLPLLIYFVFENFLKYFATFSWVSLIAVCRSYLYESLLDFGNLPNLQSLTVSPLTSHFGHTLCQKKRKDVNYNFNKSFSKTVCWTLRFFWHIFRPNYPYRPETRKMKIIRSV